MDLEFTADDLKFRDEVRAWLAQVYTDDLKRRMAMSKNHSLDEQHQKAWLKALADKGWLVPNWPVEFGGPGWTWRSPARRATAPWACACARPSS